ncbi:4-hydroxythreonine-4-phosphate dehydrogenase PdxA [Candidatus Atelocyanobacterium thalassae]|uniref:4-hydroxythreonine-4-phosphate dehydrogenase n=1 Tax=cyanobacterium endosymbiont of Braarudosphaera bigelowii TaxID=1285375 RepID=A0ABN6JZW9_9CHRO|nr:4-hydroxythreonine-4-phosphate dehydrogenase PdxA [Candidatus Atelocyanobacterium thalassa]BDA40018.1 D-threonate 4-phosphate dehydrogenase [cyanobacterium endosymbiont of Braarudosphaera bigelowii]
MQSANLSLNQRPKLALTLGDPAGIGPEIILKVLADPVISQSCELTVIGTKSILLENYQQLPIKKEKLANPERFSILDVPIDPIVQSQIIPGYGNAASGEASFKYLNTAITQTLKGNFQGIITAPISKLSWKIAGFNYPGQTEILAKRAKVDQFGMLFVAKSPYTGWIMRTLLATTHIPLNKVSQTLTPNLMSVKLNLLINYLDNNFSIKNPKIIIGGLNPHSGENGQLGTEEKDWLLPWLIKERINHPNIKLVGLVPPDTMWVKPMKAWFGSLLESEKTRNSIYTQNYDELADAYLSLYHDQGLIPVKLMAFEQAVNNTIGLPFIRTSPDHGTAFDIAGKGIARINSLREAINLAITLTK